MQQTRVRKRPKHLALHQIRMPLPSIVSILHRISGAGLFLFLPIMLWLFDQSVGTAEAFEAYRAFVSNPLIKLVLLGLIWAYLHHFCAGIRFLLLDIDVGGDLGPARRSSVAVLVISLFLTIVAGVALW
ncbi:MAG TPA: succinate dehydrogenase, cytochrome b556 subunit [Azoarcus sp.]|nr:succinate dehydrogenase, cytochrome b556 subunit [Azoarcus sp.]